MLWGIVSKVPSQLLHALQLKLPGLHGLRLARIFETVQLSLLEELQGGKQATTPIRLQVAPGCLHSPNRKRKSNNI